MKVIPSFPIDEIKFNSGSTENYDKAIEYVNALLPESHMEALNTLCAEFNLPTMTSARYGDYANLKACSASKIDCESCRDKARAHCFKYIPKNINGKIVVDKRICSANRIYELIKISNIPAIFSEKTFNNIDVGGFNHSAVIAAKSTVADGTGLYVYGRPGVGKTLLASCIVTARAKLGKPSFFASATDIIEGAKAFGDNLRREETLRKYRNVACLVIDDIGVENVTDFSLATMFDILDSRYRRNLCTVITSNFDLDKLAARYGVPHGERIRRRIEMLCRVEVIIG